MSQKSILSAMDQIADAGDRFAYSCANALKVGRGDIALLPHALNNWVRALVDAGVPAEKIKLALNDASRHPDLK